MNMGPEVFIQAVIWQLNVSKALHMSTFSVKDLVTHVCISLKIINKRVSHQYVSLVKPSGYDFFIIILNTISKQ